MSFLQLLLIAHLVIFAIWFGTDLATFSLSRRVVDPTVPVASRLTLATTMMGIEVVARLCLPTMLALGLSLSIENGLLDTGSVATTAAHVVIWVIVAAWVGVVWTIHRQTSGELASKLASGDLVLRSLVCAGLWVAGLISLIGDDGPFIGRWLALKVMAFALIMTCGIAIRFLLKPFSVAFGALATQGSSPQNEAVMTTAIRRAQPLVGVIWFCLLAATTLAVVKPFVG